MFYLNISACWFKYAYIHVEYIKYMAYSEHYARKWGLTMKNADLILMVIQKEKIRKKS